MDNASTKQNSTLNLVFKASFPIVISMIINGLYNLVDSFFVAMVSENAMTAVPLIYSIQ